MMNAHTQPLHPANASSPTLYDDVYYPGHVYEHTHPNHLATLATIYGMQPVSVERCRVLELGCGVGGNLLPMAFQYPNSEFVGVDLSGVTIERGMRNVAALGLSNIQLLHRDIMDVDASFGQFDYIIAHGVYSWVPPDVRRKMMTIFKQNLSANGVCYVSYNAHPYSHLRDMTRDMMLYHTRHVSGMKQKTAQARAIMKFISEGTPADTLHGKIMRDQYKRVTTMPEEVLFHDDLNEIATAFLLHQVTDEAAKHGLQYLSDTDFSRRHVAGYSDEVCSTLQQFPDSEFVARDQYQDFIDGNGFRRTLLCHDNIALERRVDRDFVTRFHLLCTAKPVSSEFNLNDMSPMEFKTHDDSSLTISKPILKAAHCCLGRAWPRALSFPDLLAGARDLLGSGPNSGRADDDEQTLIGAMYILVCSGEVTFLRWPPFVVRDVSDRPQASLLARKQAESGTLLTNVLHQAVRLADDRARYFLQLLDGTRTMEQLATEMTDKFGDLPPADNNSGDVPTQSVSERVAQSLATVSKLGLLVG